MIAQSVALIWLWAAFIRPAMAVDFVRDIQSIFRKHCTSCHGPDKPRGGLRLDAREPAMHGGDDGPILRPGSSAQSPLIERITHADPNKRMPHDKPPLSAAQIDALRQWIDSGAAWPDEAAGETRARSDHWAFSPVRRPEIPSVRDSARVQNPIDAFILARLDRESIPPSPAADRRTLIRRLSLDLLGLPPDPRRVEQFAADRAADAYPKLVDEFLASPHFGERWGRYWLDLARYADSDGYLDDKVRPFAWVYRDWVIKAINRDMPFDQFTIEQLAGDLLPGATAEQKIATGFHRNSLKNTEAGIDKEEDRNKVAVDRVATTGAVWLGLTVGCAECHTHKYDPITQREFYQLFAFFNNTDDADISAALPAEQAAYQTKLREWDKKRARLQSQIDTHVAGPLAAAQRQWEASVASPTIAWSILQPGKLASAGGATLKASADGLITHTGKNPPTDTLTFEFTSSSSRITAIRLDVIGEAGKGKTVGRSRAGGAIVSEITASLKTASSKKARPLTFQFAAASHVSAEGPVLAAIDGDPQTGWKLGSLLEENHAAVFEFDKPLELQSGDKLILTIKNDLGYGEALRRFRVSAADSPPPLAADLISPQLRLILSLPEAKRDAVQREVLAAFYRQIDPELYRLNLSLGKLMAARPTKPATKAQALAVAAKPRQTHIHVRGDFLRHGDRVAPGVLSVLHPFQPRGPVADRLDLARWLVDPANPLTARVTVNQIWSHLLGRGLVSSVDDFGTRGEKPTHPELLDWLADEFIRTGWSRKKMIRLIVSSAAYQQSSENRDDLETRDPLNALLARQSRGRLEAETVRDVFLAASGLLDETVGGPSIYPPLPKFVTAVGRDPNWPTTPGSAQHRRGMYIFFRRNIPYPMLLTFDAPDSSVSCTRRERSNTPLQALTMLNDPVFVECAAALGRRIAAEGAGVDSLIRAAFERCMSRPPGAAEGAALRQYYDEQLAILKSAPESVAKITGEPDSKPETAAAIALARVILNLDEFITRE